MTLLLPGSYLLQGSLVKLRGFDYWISAIGNLFELIDI